MSSQVFKVSSMAELSAPQSWYLAQVKPNSQRIARENLDRQGFATFLPGLEVTRRAQGRFRVTTQPLFPGYLFVALDPAQGRWRAVNSTIGVARLVSFGAKPAEVPRDLVAALMAQCDANELLTGTPGPRPGDTVEITAGPFAEFVAEVQNIDSERRVWVLLDLMGRSTRVALREQDIRLVFAR